MDPIKPLSFPAVKMDMPVRSIHVKQEAKDSSAEVQKKPEHVSQAIQQDLGVEDIRLNYSLDSPTGQVVVKVVDGKSGKVIREIPPSELLALAASMKELEGIIFDKKI